MENLNESNYFPNESCPFCKAETMPQQKLEWCGWGLAITQTCPACGKEWVENWTLQSVECQE